MTTTSCKLTPTEPSSCRRVFGVVATIAALSSAAIGCGGTRASTTPTIELAPTSTPITTAPTNGAPTDGAPTDELPPAEATTGTTPASASDSTTDGRADVAEIEAAVAAARQVHVEVLTDPSAPVERMETVATGRALEATVENTLKARAEGQTFAGGFLGIPIETQLLSATTATHIGCGIDGLASFTADGEILVPADDTAYLRRYELEIVDGRWLVELVSFEGSEKTPCEL